MSYSASGNLIDRIMNTEGFRSLPYQDSGGLWTIGYGRRCKPNEPATTRAKEKAWMLAKLVSICHDIEGLFGPDALLQHELDALVSFIYNAGTEGFRKSNVYRLLKAPNTDAYVWWKKWIRDDKGQIQPGLVKRRHFETVLHCWGWTAADRCEL